MKKKKVLTILLLLSLGFVLLQGCTSKSAGNEVPNPSGDVAKTAAVSTNPVTYTMEVGDDKISWDTPITKKITEKTGVSLKYEVNSGSGTGTSKRDVWLASGDYPDIIPMDNQTLVKYRDAGAVIPLEKLIDQYGPNIKAKLGKYYDLLKNPDGHIYALYGLNLAEEAPANLTGNFIVQYAVLEEAGFPQIRTLDELHKIINDYAQKHPKINGQSTIGFGGAMSGWMIKFMFNNPAFNAAGYPDHGNWLVDKQNNVIWNPVSNEAKRYYQFMNKLYNEGLLDQEAFSMDSNAFSAKLSQGRLLAAYAPSWLADPVNKSLRAEGKLDQQYAFLPLFFDKDTVDNTNAKSPLDANSAGVHMWAITDKAKNPERIIQMLDYLYSDEGMILTHWGIEGQHYKVVDGKRTLTDEWVKQMAADPDAQYKAGFTGATISYWPTVGDSTKLKDGDYATPVTKDIVRMKYDDKTKEVLGKYGKQVWADFLGKPTTLPGFVWQIQMPEDVNIIGAKLNDELWPKVMPKIIMAKTDQQFEEQYKQFVTEAQTAGLEKYNKAYTDKWKAYVQNYETLVK